ncbi:hypothetical protein [Paenibacillus alvei]|uniref:hypothetical protein n=1 Tax=Paenibacillus alvei TaxID=44250 RepID=UPI0022815637|nr:hypothetical protein [Paenibacillus alvei]
MYRHITLYSHIGAWRLIDAAGAISKEVETTDASAPTNCISAASSSGDLRRWGVMIYWNVMRN